MLILISKTFSLLFYPLGLALGLIAASGVALYFRKGTAGFALVISAFCILYLFSADPLSYWLVRSLESRYHPEASFPPASAVVLLTGGEVPRVGPRIYDEIGEGGDRILYACRLMNRRAAPRLIITGGNIDFLRTIEGSQAQAAYRIFSLCNRSDSTVVHLENNARNTYENGLYTRRLLDSLKLRPAIILVTSALHMPRSVAVFKRLGCIVFPAPTDYLADAPYQWKPIYFLPSAGALNNSSRAIHERYGMLSYKVLGWL
ncbi:MAG: YdcF family protein [Chitinispirillaceae bacterium]|nr:YdcF family protein [Chitinispirillaceae bacterium]